MKLTIFTPTYNREKYLSRLYESLKKQKFKDFEWLIIDDESTDNTIELIKKFINEKNEFQINFVRIEHGGKHRALNKAFDIAKGEYFFIVDSDDYITDDAVEKIYEWIEETRDIEYLAGFSGLRRSESGISGGKPLVNKQGWIDASNLERLKYQLLGEKAEVYRTEILRKHKFPEFENEYFVSEDVCWNAIAHEGYKLRWYNHVIYIFEYLDTGLTKSKINEIEGSTVNFNGYNYRIKNLIKYRGLTNNPRMIREYMEVAKRKKLSVRQMANYLEIPEYQVKMMPIFLFFGFTKSFLKKFYYKSFRKVLIGGKL